jgi:hypothetical protein
MGNIESEEHQCPKPSPFPFTTICFSQGCVLFSLCSISSRHIDKVKHFSYFSLGCYLAPVNIAAAFVFLEACVEGERKTLFRGVLLRFFYHFQGCVIMCVIQELPCSILKSSLIPCTHYTLPNATEFMNTKFYNKLK